ncbi:hypothetical protein TNCV_345831 [Trichonephila clavipes]|nr:hypothetical protein TNCV_345831 [Trichonephila clavipes]
MSQVSVKAVTPKCLGGPPVNRDRLDYSCCVILIQVESVPRHAASCITVSGGPTIYSADVKNWGYCPEKNISRMLIGRTIESSRCGRPREHWIRVLTGDAL